MALKLKATDNGALFQAMLQAQGLPAAQREYRFCDRMWRFDWAWPGVHKVALEVEGGVWSMGRHLRSTGFLKDMEKYNEAAILGWCVLRCTPQDIETGKVFELLRRVL